MCGIWDWQSTIVKDLNDSQDPKHTLICRESAFVAIYALFSDIKCPLFTRLGRGVAQSGHCLLFLPFFLYDGFPNVMLGTTVNRSAHDLEFWITGHRRRLSHVSHILEPVFMIGFDHSRTSASALIFQDNVHYDHCSVKKTRFELNGVQKFKCAHCKVGQALSYMNFKANHNQRNVLFHQVSHFGR